MLKSPLLCNLDDNDVVVTGEPNCALTPAQQENARKNIGVDSVLGDIASVLDTLNGEVV